MACYRILYNFPQRASLCRSITLSCRLLIHATCRLLVLVAHNGALDITLHIAMLRLDLLHKL